MSIRRRRAGSITFDLSSERLYWVSEVVEIEEEPRGAEKIEEELRQAHRGRDTHGGKYADSGTDWPTWPNSSRRHTEPIGGSQKRPNDHEGAWRKTMMIIVWEAHTPKAASNGLPSTTFDQLRTTTFDYLRTTSFGYIRIWDTLRGPNKVSLSQTWPFIEKFFQFLELFSHLRALSESSKSGFVTACSANRLPFSWLFAFGLLAIQSTCWLQFGLLSGWLSGSVAGLLTSWLIHWLNSEPTARSPLEHPVSLMEIQLWAGFRIRRLGNSLVAKLEENLKASGKRRNAKKCEKRTSKKAKGTARRASRKMNEIVWTQPANWASRFDHSNGRCRFASESFIFKFNFQVTLCSFRESTAFWGKRVVKSILHIMAQYGTV